jgi:hypothetical protein
MTGCRRHHAKDTAYLLPDRQRYSASLRPNRHSRKASHQARYDQAKEAVVPEVTVSAERPTNRIDRQVYDVKSDVSSTNGTAADASTTCHP